MTIPIGKAAMIDTDCRFAIELSEKISATGSRMRRILQKLLSLPDGSAPSGRA